MNALHAFLGSVSLFAMLMFKAALPRSKLLRNAQSAFGTFKASIACEESRFAACNSNVRIANIERHAVPWNAGLPALNVA